MGNNDFPDYGKHVGAQVEGRLYQAVIQAVHDAQQRNDHEEHGGIDEAHGHRHIVVEHFHRLLQDSPVNQKMIDHAAFSQQNHPPVDAHQFTDPEGHKQQQT